jgi:hypothetical protein
VPYEKRNCLPIKHLQNAPNALFGTKRTDSVHDTVHMRWDLASPLTPVIARRCQSISARVGKGKRRIRLSAEPPSYVSIVGHRMATPPLVFARKTGGFRSTRAPAYMRFYRLTNQPALPLRLRLSIHSRTQFHTQSDSTIPLQEDSVCQRPLPFKTPVHPVVR